MERGTNSLVVPAVLKQVAINVDASMEKCLMVIAVWGKSREEFRGTFQELSWLNVEADSGVQNPLAEPIPHQAKTEFSKQELREKYITVHAAEFGKPHFEK